ncbi:MAG: hypothetical protein IMX04_00800 [Candidatus Carbobacillus altaicus]|nr:hypothetical protein [Candidatus Carbobacillus altaicus]
MKLVRLKFRLLRQDFIKIFLLCFGIPIFTFLLIAGNKMIASEWTAHEFLHVFFGSVMNLPLNWMYWIFLSFGYVLLLQIVWKPHAHMYEIYQILRYKDIGLYWQIELVVGFLFTVFYLFCYFAVMFTALSVLRVQALWDVQWVIILFAITLNLFIHALIWLTLKMYTLVEVANIVSVLLFYAGVRIAEPYIPLYYAMVDHIKGYILSVFAMELVIILILAAFIIRKAKTMDLD